MSQPPGTQSVTTDLCGIPPGAVSGPTPFPDCHAQWRWICRWLLPQRSATPPPTFLTLFFPNPHHQNPEKATVGANARPVGRDYHHSNQLACASLTPYVPCRGVEK